jgi:hypothetical protein
MTQSYNRAQLYARLLQEAYEAADRLAQLDLESEGLVGDVPRDGNAAAGTVALVPAQVLKLVQHSLQGVGVPPTPEDASPRRLQ